jgi:hypothetical protein
VQAQAKTNPDSALVLGELVERTSEDMALPVVPVLEPEMASVLGLETTY